MADNPLRYDPTRTTMLQRKYAAEFNRRVNEVMAEILKLLVDEDAFGLEATTGNPVFNTRWQFRTTDAKLKAFQEWLQRQIDAKLLTTDGSTGRPWTDKYVTSAHKQGLLRAFTDANKKSGEKAGSFFEGTKAQFLKQSFNQPEMLSKIRMLATRNYEELKGITQQMGKNMNRILADGLTAGKGPKQIARELRKEVGFSKSRAERVARTEIIHAHAEGQLDGFEELGVDDLNVMAEWLTAGDRRVCAQCSALEGTVMSVKEARGLLPRHPNCRCAWIPANVGESSKGQKASQTQIAKAIEKSVKAEKPNSKNPKRDSNWLGAGKRFRGKKGT